MAHASRCHPGASAGGTTNLVKCLKAVELRANVTVDAIQSKSNKDGTECGSEETSHCSLGYEQLLHINIPIPHVKQPLEETKKTHLIVMADNSGSMSGNPWKQVQMAVVNMKKDLSLQGTNLEMDMIIYNSRAELVNLEGNFEETIRSIKPCGTTDFIKAFDLVKTMIKPNEKGEVFTRSRVAVNQTIVVFMTDGQDTTNAMTTVKKASKSLTDYFGDMKYPVTVHVVGFSQDHDLDFLKGLQMCGNQLGMYRYCESSDGPEALAQKLTQLFDFVSMGGPEVKLLVTLTSEGQIVSQEGTEKSAVLTGQIVERSDTQSGVDDHNTLQKNSPTGGNLTVEAEGWLYLSDPQILPQMEITLQLPFEEETVPVSVSNTQRHLIVADWERVLWSVRILSLSADRLAYKFSKALGEGQSKDFSKLERRLSQLQKRVSHTQVYGRGITKEYRDAVFTHVKQIQTKVDQMHSLMARYKRGEGGSVGFIARANDLRYEAQFSKSRRQRLMDVRVSRNANFVTSTQASLDSLLIDPANLQKLSSDALDFFFCVLSQNNIKDILEGSDKGDMIGFGLAVKRPEHVVDEPTGLNLCLISGTLVSRSSMMDALEHKIRVTGHLKAHGGFNFENELGVATVGTSREPINAWLPLYICESHWQRVKLLLRPTLGYLCTLDPLGYDNRQADVLFMTLGCMIGQLKPNTTSEHQLRLLFGFQRLCAATIREFDLVGQVASLVENFVESPLGRTKDILNSLYTLVGYIVCLPHEDAQRIFQVKGNDRSTLHKFWLGFIAECVRRGARSAFHETSEGVVDGIIDQILHGVGQGILSGSKAKKVEPCVSCQDAALLQALRNSKADDLVLDIPVFNPATGITGPQVTVKHSDKVDQAMDLWARVQCGLVKNKNQADKVRGACKIVENWLEEGNAMVGRTNDKSETETAKEDEEEHCIPDFNTDNLTQSMIDTMAAVMKRIEKNMFPSLVAIPGCIAFVQWWLTQQPDWQELDDNSGLAPDSWVETVKAAISKVHKVLSTENVDPDILVTVVEDPGTSSSGCEAGKSSNDESMTATHCNTTSQTCTEPENTASDDDGDVSDYEDYYDGYESDEDAHIHHSMSSSRVAQYINLPGLLGLLEPDLDLVTCTRGLLCQALHFNKNARARAGAAGNSPGVQLLDMGLGMPSAVSTLVSLQKDLIKRRVAALEKLCDEALWQRANHCMFLSTSVWAFIGYLMNTYKERGEGFSNLVAMMLDLDLSKRAPCLAEKLRVMLLGKHADCAVLASGNIWLPEKKTCQQLEAVLGTEEWIAMEIDLRSCVQIHVYRESDIPNRHGHCNSNPYIPNDLRKKLGMPLMPVFKAKTRQAKRS